MLIVKWTVTLYERDINDLPIIVALQEEVRVKPELAGGDEISFKGLSVNRVLDQSQNKDNLDAIKLAPINQDVLSGESSPALVPIDKVGTDQEDIANSITSALQTLLGLGEQSQPEIKDTIELHIASYGTADKANAHWFLLQQLNSDLLVNYNHQVVKVPDTATETYRLRIIGFTSVALAQDLCDRLIERGERCVPAVGDL